MDETTKDDANTKYLRALLALQLAGLAETEAGQRAELLLYRAGLGIKEIAELRGKSYAAVAKAISRGRSRGK